MYKDSFNWVGFLLRLLFALVLVYATYNPEGYSYFHWIQASLNHPETGLLGSNALKFVAGILLLGGLVALSECHPRLLRMDGRWLAVGL